jgi:hypothetical protein
MFKGDPAPLAGGHRISAGRHSRDGIKPVAPQAQARAQLFRIGAAVGFAVSARGARAAVCRRARSRPLTCHRLP